MSDARGQSADADSAVADSARDCPRSSPAAAFRRHVAVGLAVSVAIGLEFVCVGLLVGMRPPFSIVADAPVAAACAAHLLAVVAALGAARMQGARTGTEMLATLVTALFVPLFGPGLGWAFRHRDDDAVENAHAHFERLEEAEKYEREILHDDVESDFAQEINATSYAQILRQGTLQRRRNLLRNLGRLGSPDHVAVIRQCLEDDDPEIRLCAHAELDRLARRYEDRIEALRGAVLAAREAGTLSRRELIPLAGACRDYAGSGIFEREMQEFWLERAAEYTDEAAAMEPGDAGLTRARADLMVLLGRIDAATELLDSLRGEEAQSHATLVVRAEIAFGRRDFEAIREIARIFDAQFVPLPHWMASLLGGSPTFDPGLVEPGPAAPLDPVVARLLAECEAEELAEEAAAAQAHAEDEVEAAAGAVHRERTRPAPPKAPRAPAQSDAGSEVSS